MLLDLGDEVLAALRSSGQSGRVWGVAEYQDVQAELRVEQSGSVTFSGSSVEAQSATDVVVFGSGGSLVPRLKTDLLAPYGQEVVLFRDVTVRDSTWTVPLGVFRVTANSGAVESIRETAVDGAKAADVVFEVGDGLYALNPYVVPAGDGLYSAGAFTEDPHGSGLYVPRSAEFSPSYDSSDVVSWQVRVELVDRLRMIARAKIIGPQSYPLPGNTVWDELRRLVPFPVVESLPDTSVPAGVTYEDRPDAVKLLCDALGGVPAVTRDGAFTVRLKDAWAAAAAGLVGPVFDIEGTISWDDGQSDEFVNYVWAHSDDGKFSGFASLDDPADPLSVSRAGMSSYEHSSPLYKSRAQAQAGAESLLARLLGSRSRQVTVECLPEALLLELGDVGWVRDPVQGRTVLGEVVSMDVPLDPLEPVRLTLTVAEEA